MVPLKLRAALVAAAALSLASSPVAPVARHALADRGCKPLAPLAVELTAREPSGGPQVTLDFDLAPVLAMQDVSWELELGDGLTLVQGPADGEAAPARGQHTTGSVRVALPADGRPTRATLVVTGHFTGHDETGAPSDETVELRRSLSWGVPAEGPSFTATDPVTGEPASFMAVPAASSLSGHKVGR